ncbi:MAG: DnaJ domain-containing protein [Bacillota bacterium]|nr:DnaJ domain-containing protein [Bacillota bacterium]
MKKYFVNVETMEDLKKAYRKLVLELHPDRNNGQDAAFKEMVNEYDVLFKELQGKTTNAAEQAEDINQYKDIINSLMAYEGLEIDIVGTWIWVGGNTKPVSEIFKELGFYWAKKKVKWYYRPAEQKCSRKSNMTYEEIKSKYGCQSIKSKGAACIA